MVGTTEYLFAFGLVCVYALSHVYRALGQLTPIVFAISFGAILFGWFYILQTLVAAIIIWLSYREMRVKRNFERLWNPFIWIFMLTWLTWLHLERGDWFNPKWGLHVSGCVMLMVIKYTSLAGSPSVQAVTLTQWLGWTYFLPSFFAGPTLDLHEYLNYLRVENENNNGTEAAQSVLLEAIWFLPFVLLGQEMFPIHQIAQFEQHHGMLYRVLFLWMSMWCIRCRYYFAWKLSEAAYKASGADRFQINGGCNVNVWKVERSDNVHAILSNWNICTANWLKLHVYIPANAYFKNERLAILITNVTSALWHGLYPGYFITFIGAGIATTVGRLTHVHVVPIINRFPQIVQSFYKLIMMIVMSVLICTIGLPFQVYTFDLIWESWKGIYFIGHIWLGEDNFFLIKLLKFCVLQDC